MTVLYCNQTQNNILAVQKLTLDETVQVFRAEDCPKVKEVDLGKPETFSINKLNGYNQKQKKEIDNSVNRSLNMCTQGIYEGWKKRSFPVCLQNESTKAG